MRQCLKAMHVRVALTSQATETSFKERDEHHMQQIHTESGNLCSSAVLWRGEHALQVRLWTEVKDARAPPPKEPLRNLLCYTY